jgi:hypothetical protein
MLGRGRRRGAGRLRLMGQRTDRAHIVSWDFAVGVPGSSGRPSETNSVSEQQVSAGSARKRAIAVLVAGLTEGTYLFWVQANSGLLFVASRVDHLGGDGVCAWFRVEATHAGDSGVGVARLVGGASTRGRRRDDRHGDAEMSIKLNLMDISSLRRVMQACYLIKINRRS